MYDISYNCECQKSCLEQRDYGSNNQNPEYYYPLSPYYDYNRVKEDKYMNPIPSVISPKNPETNIFNFDFPNLEYKEINDKNQKKNENNQKIINQKDKDNEKEKKINNNVNDGINDKGEKEEKDEEEIEAIMIKDEEIDFNKLLKLTNCDKPIISKKMTNNNNKENLNYKPKFIVIKNAKLKKRKKRKKRYRMKGFYKSNKPFRGNTKKTLNKNKKKEKDNFLNNISMDSNNTKILFQNENEINNRNINYTNNDYNNYNNNLIYNNMNNNMKKNMNNMNNIYKNNSIKFYQKQQIPLRNNLINTKTVYKDGKDDSLKNFNYNGNMIFNNPNEYKVKENISNLSNAKKFENDDNTYTGTLNSSANFIPQIFESKASGTLIDGIEYATLLVPKNYVEIIKQIIADE